MQRRAATVSQPDRPDLAPSLDATFHNGQSTATCTYVYKPAYLIACDDVGSDDSRVAVTLFANVNARRLGKVACVVK